MSRPLRTPLARASIPRIDLRASHHHPATHEENLWLSVALRAIQDAERLDYEDRKAGSQRKERQMAQDALEFLGDPERHAPILAAAGIRPEWGMRQIRVAGYRKMLG